MSYSRVTSRKVVLPAAAVTRVWDAPAGLPIKDMQIYIESAQVLAAGTVVWDILTGGHWLGGNPFAAGSTHHGGISRVSGGILGGSSVSESIVLPIAVLPPSVRAANGSVGGTPLVLEIDNQTADAIVFNVSFISTELGGIA